MKSSSLTDRHPDFSLQETAIPPPAAYPRQISYDGATNTISHENIASEYVPHTHTIAENPKAGSSHTSFTEIGLEDEEKHSKGERTSSTKPRWPIIRWLSGSRFYIRGFTIMVMMVSFALILTAVIMFEKHGQSASGAASITDFPCRVFVGIATMNLVLSSTFLLLSCISSKFRNSNNAVNAVFTLIAAAGFASSMGACFFLNKENTLKQDLWRWSCNNHKNGVTSDALDFNLICNIINQGWKLGIVQASFELLTFLVSIMVWIWLRWTFFSRYGFFGVKLC
ncbi:hypothetical protein ACMFMG_007062 [Clarireedia jacksonii]